MGGKSPLYAPALSLSLPVLARSVLVRTFACPKIDFDGRVATTVVDVTTNDFEDFVTHAVLFNDLEADGAFGPRLSAADGDGRRAGDLLDWRVVTLVSRSMAGGPGREGPFLVLLFSLSSSSFQPNADENRMPTDRQ